MSTLSQMIICQVNSSVCSITSWCFPTVKVISYFQLPFGLKLLFIEFEWCGAGVKLMHGAIP